MAKKKQYAAQKQKHRQQQERSNRLLLVALTALVALGLGAFLYFGSPRFGVDLKDQPVLGREEAPHTLVVFGDLKCSACRDFSAQAGAAIERAVSDGQLKYAFLHYPFIARKENLSEDDSTLMARAAECAFSTGTAGDHERLVRGLYRQQGAESGVWGGQSQLPGLIERSGFTAQRAQAIASCAASDQAAARAVDADHRQGDAARLQGTPLVIYDGKVTTNYQNLISTLNGLKAP